MKYYSYSESLSGTYRKAPKAQTAQVQRERVPATISPLDVLLSIWIAEAVLETEPPKSRVPRRIARKHPAA